MKKKKIMKKQFLSILCIAVMLFVLSGCSTKNASNQEVENKDTITSTAEDYLSTWNELDIDSALEQYGDQLGDEEKAIYESWKNIKKEIGTYKEITDRTYEKPDDDTTIVTLRAQYEKKSIDFSVTFDSKGQLAAEPSIEIYTTMQEKLAKAGLNTIMCIAIVFIVLIFISFIISLLKYIPRLLGLEKKKEIIVSEVVPAAPVADEEENLTDDTELVAVITAAIMASMGSEAPADGLVISSIKRRTSNKWKKR